MLNKRVATLLIGTILMGSLAVGCGSSDSSNSNKITISGSTSVGPVVEILGEDFEAKNEGVSIEVQQIGSSAGIKNAIDGTSQIGMASRDLKDEEKAAGLKETQIAIDGIAVITNKNNTVKDLTLEQVKDIYTGKITNWKENGKDDIAIETFKKWVQKIHLLRRCTRNDIILLLVGILSFWVHPARD